MRTEISCGPKGEKLAWFWFSVRIQTVKTWPIDPLGLRNIQLEVSEKFPQGELACGSQALIATLLFDPSMSALPRQPLQGLMIIWGGAMVCVGGGRQVKAGVFVRSFGSVGKSLWAQHYQDQQRARKGRQKPPFETGKQHGVAGSRAPIFGLRLEVCEGKRRVQNLEKKGLEWACRPNTTKTSKEPERGVKSHPSKRGNSMVSRAHVHPFSAFVWRSARANVASRT